MIIQIYKWDGIRGLYWGLGAISGRAILANGFGFLAWEYSKKLF